jgi:hypothetical protein
MDNNKLNDLFTVHICGLSTCALAGRKGRWYKPESGEWELVPDFCDNLGAVIPWLDSIGCWTSTFHGDLHSVGIKNGDRITAYGVDSSMAKAAMIAALKSKGISV